MHGGMAHAGAHSAWAAPHLVLERQDAEPRQHRKDAVLLADVVAAGAERLLAAHAALACRQDMRVASTCAYMHSDSILPAPTHPPLILRSSSAHHPLIIRSSSAHPRPRVHEARVPLVGIQEQECIRLPTCTGIASARAPCMHVRMRAAACWHGCSARSASVRCPPASMRLPKNFQPVGVSKKGSLSASATRSSAPLVGMLRATP